MNHTDSLVSCLGLPERILPADPAVGRTWTGEVVVRSGRTGKDLDTRKPRARSDPTRISSSSRPAVSTPVCGSSRRSQELPTQTLATMREALTAEGWSAAGFPGWRSPAPRTARKSRFRQRPRSTWPRHSSRTRRETRRCSVERVAAGVQWWTETRCGPSLSGEVVGAALRPTADLWEGVVRGSSAATAAGGRNDVVPPRRQGYLGTPHRDHRRHCPGIATLDDLTRHGRYVLQNSMLWR